MQPTRLILSRYLYDRAQATLETSDGFSFGLSVSLAQDAVETMLNEVGSTVKANIPQHTTFPKLWAAINQSESMQNPLPYSRDIDSLNNCRVAFKHHSNLPDEATAHRHLVNAGYFLDTVCKDILGVAWEEISISDAIGDTEIRGYVKEAEKLLKSGNLDDCRQQCSLAHHEIQRRFNRIFPQLPSGLMFHNETPQDQILEALMQTANSLSSEVANVSLGLKRIDILRFEQLIPQALVSPITKSVQYIDKGPHQITVEDVRFCVRHVTQMAIRYESRYVNQ